MKISSAEVYANTLYQIGALAAFAQSAGTRLHHVKAHGALYNLAARDPELADTIASAVQNFDRSLILVGLAGSALVDAGHALGLTVAREGFCDRRYRADGTLTKRSEPGAVIEDAATAAAQAVSIATRHEATASDGTRVHIEADTLCIHGDRANAARFAEQLRQALAQAGVEISASHTPA